MTAGPNKDSYRQSKQSEADPREHPQPWCNRWESQFQSADVVLMKGDVIYDNRLLSNLGTGFKNYKIQVWFLQPWSCFYKAGTSRHLNAYASSNQFRGLNVAHVCTLNTVLN